MKTGENTTKNTSHASNGSHNARAIGNCPCVVADSEAKSDSLGIYTKSQVMPENKGLRSCVRRAEKYVLQNEVIKLLPKERVRGCLRYRISASDNVEVRYNSRREKAHYSNVQRCGSVWVCPVCSAQISEGRRQELSTGMDNWTSQGCAVYLVTFTNPHHVGDNLEDLLNGQKKAFVKLWEKTKVKNTLKALGYKGRVVATEVTHGKNGWHPHYHVLMFFEHHIDAKSLRNFLGLEWQIACKKVGLKKPSLEHGLDVRDGSFAKKYVSKWGLEDEMTKGHVKKGRDGSMTPWDMLRASVGGDEKAGRLFKQFASAFKGKRQLVWSRGLKQLLAVDEVTDEELATETDKDSVQVNTLDIKIWKIILSCKLRSKYLECVEDDIKDGSDTASDLIIEHVPIYLQNHPDELAAFFETITLQEWLHLSMKE